MPIPLTRPVVFFDLETTGLDFKYDRVFEIGALKILPDGRREIFNKRINPGIRIPKEVTAITGVNNEAVASCPHFGDLLPEIDKFFGDSDLGGYNILRFDAKVLTEEYRREGWDFKLDTRAIVDVQIIFHQKEKRDLSAAYKFYCNKDLKDAHSAKADVEATCEIWMSQMKRYGDLPKDIQGFNSFCRQDRERYADSEGKFYWRDGEAVFNFGKYKSQSLRSVAQKDPGYLSWVISPDRHFSQDVVDICYAAKQGKFPVKK
ncbi:hypothetical protein BVX98_05995 [bacterium F11]|nr:hypothetical protein BVX98_05995 [bacterium F11]